MAWLQYQMRRSALLARRQIKPVSDRMIGGVAVKLLDFARAFDTEKLSNVAGDIAKIVGRVLPENRIARENIAAAFPEKSAAEIDAILTASWRNLGRIGAEFAHLDRLWDLDNEARSPSGRIEVDEATIARFLALRDDGKPALLFAAHLGNWELPALAGPAYGVDTTILYRRPNIENVDRAVFERRSVNMGTMVATQLDAPLRLADALRRGSHVGMLVDQYSLRGVDVTLFGRTTRANPLLARLLRQIECPVHGVRVIRLPGHRFRVELTPELVPERDSTGAIDVAKTTQAVMGVIEGWIREHPEQWLWQHRRWR